MQSIALTKTSNGGPETRMSERTPRKPLALVRGDETIVFTPKQVSYIVAKAKGKNPVAGSTHALASQKIKAATGWQGSGIALFCRFAVHHGLVQL